MKKFIAATLLVALALYLLLSSFVIDTQINKYDTRQTAVKQHAIEQGRVPSILPDSAYDISEMYEPKMHTIYGAFSYKEPDEKALLSKLKETKDKDHTREWGNFLFRVDQEKNRVKYKTKSFHKAQ
jgi:hypothetical protein